MELPAYPIIYKKSFVLFWGLSLGAAMFCGGLLLFALVALMMLVLIHHEHAHLKECERLGAKIDKVVFNIMGGQVHFTAQTISDTISICKSGVMNSLYYAISFIGLWIAVEYLGISLSWNFADSAPGIGLLYYMRFLNGIILFAVVLVVSNVLPIVYHHKKYGEITTDGWAAYQLKSVELESWNDGKCNALGVT